MRQAFLHALDIRLGSDRSIAASSRLHSRNVVAFQIDHLARSEHRPDSLELTATNPRVQIGSHLRERRFAHGSFKRVTQQFAVLDDSLPFHVAIAGPRDGFLGMLCGSVRSCWTPLSRA